MEMLRNLGVSHLMTNSFFLMSWEKLNWVLKESSKKHYGGILQLISTWKVRKTIFDVEIWIFLVAISWGMS